MRGSHLPAHRLPQRLLVLAPAGIEGFIINPAWYGWLGLALRTPV